MTAEILTEAAEDVETVLVSWLRPLYPDGHVSNDRRSGDPLPYVLVHHLDSNEDICTSSVDALVSIHVLTHKAAGEVSSRDEMDTVHRRLLLLGRYLEDVALIGGRNATIDYFDVSSSPKREEYGDEMILRRVGRYNLGLSYVEVQ